MSRVLVFAAAGACCALFGALAPDTSDELAQKRLSAAKVVMDFAVSTKNLVERRGEYVEDVYTWSVRVLDSSGRSAVAYEEHLHRMMDLEAKVEALVNKGRLSPFDLSRVHYYVAEAQYWKAKG
jgi:hypothetical protein